MGIVADTPVSLVVLIWLANAPDASLWTPSMYVMRLKICLT